MTEKEFYKKIRLAIELAVDRFYLNFELDDEALQKATVRSILNEYKREYPFKE